MYARLVLGSIPPAQLDAAVALWRAEVLPSVQQQPGFRGVRLMVDRAAGRIVSLGLWEQPADYQASVAWNQGQLDKFAAFFSAPPEVGGYDVIEDLRR